MASLAEREHVLQQKRWLSWIYKNSSSTVLLKALRYSINTANNAWKLSFSGLARVMWRRGRDARQILFQGRRAGSLCRLQQQAWLQHGRQIQICLERCFWASTCRRRLLLWCGSLWRKSHFHQLRKVPNEPEKKEDEPSAVCMIQSCNRLLRGPVNGQAQTRNAL